MPALGRVSWWDVGSDSQVGCICGRKGRAVTPWLCLQPSASAAPQVQAWEGGTEGELSSQVQPHFLSSHLCSASFKWRRSGFKGWEQQAPRVELALCFLLNCS